MPSIDLVPDHKRDKYESTFYQEEMAGSPRVSWNPHPRGFPGPVLGLGGSEI